MIRAIIFDLDGTLLNTLEDITDSTNETLRTFGQPERTLDEIRTFVGNGARKLIERALTEPVDAETFEKMLAFYSAYYYDHQTVKTKPYPETQALLRTLREKGFRTAVLSNKQDEITKPLCAHFFPDLLDLASGPSEGRRGKPAPDGVFYIAEQLGVPLSEVLFVGDSETDVRTGLNAGVQTVAVLWGFRDRKTLIEAGAENFAGSCAEILQFISAKQ